MSEEYIAHHQVKGARWGVRHGPPYPVVRGAGGKPKMTKVIKSKLKETISKRKETKVEKREESAAERHERLRKEVIRDPKKIVKNKDMFSREELDEMIKQIEFDRKLQDVRQKEIQRGRDRFDSFQKNVANIKTLAINSKELYNVVADVNNMLVDAGKVKGKRLPKIGGNDQQNNNQDQNSSNSSNNDGNQNSGKKKK